MVLINMDIVYELTILLCGLQRERKKREWMGLIENACKSFLPKHEKGSFGEKRKYSSRGKGGRRSACGSS